MRKLFLVLVVFLSILILSSPAFAGRYDREDQNTVGYTDFKIELVDGVAIDAPVYIYGVTITPTATNGYAMLIDQTFPDGALLDATLNGTREIEVAGTTTNVAVRTEFNPPLQFNKAIGIDVTNATITIEYRQ